MANEPNTLPELLRQTDRPIIIYQGGPPMLEPRAGGALGLLAWLALFTLCMLAAAACFWTVWNPNFDKTQDSVIFADGRPLGLMRQVEERRAINDAGAGVTDFLDRLRDDNLLDRGDTPGPALFAARDGIDELRRQWDALCNNARDRIYARRVAHIDGQIAELRQVRAEAHDPAARANIDAQLRTLLQQRGQELQNRRLNADPALRCTPADQAAPCSDSSSDLWCNPQLNRPEEFSDEASNGPS